MIRRPEEQREKIHEGRHWRILSRNHLSIRRHWYYGQRRIRNFHLTSSDLNYSDRSAEELVCEHLIDLNASSSDQLAGLGLSAETQEHLIENRLRTAFDVKPGDKLYVAPADRVRIW
jgi:hypothetical protein